MSLDSPRDQVPRLRVPLTGQQVTSLMRQYRVTIRALSQRTGITQKRIRQVRSTGLCKRNAIRDWIEAITGQDPGPIHP